MERRYIRVANGVRGEGVGQKKFLAKKNLILNIFLTKAFPLYQFAVNVIEIDWLIPVVLRLLRDILNLYWDLMINAEGLQNLGLWLGLTVIVQSGIFIVTRDLVGLIGRNASFSRLLRQSMIYNNLDLHGIYRKKSNWMF